MADITMETCAADSSNPIASSSSSPAVVGDHHHSEPPALTAPSASPEQDQMDFLAPSYSFLEKVKMEFATRPEVFDHFLQIMKSFNELGTIGVVNEVVQLFQGKDALLAQFALFLPQGHQILNQSSLHATASSSPPPSCSEEPSTAATSTATSGTSEYVLVIPTAVAEEDELPPSIMSPKPSGMDQALEFVRRVKERFSQRDSETTSFQSFLDMLNSIQTQPKSFIEIVKQVSDLFRDHPDLLQDFPLFLPCEVRQSAMREIEEIIARRKRSQSVKEKRGHTTAKQASSSSFSKRSNSNLCLPSTAGLAIPSAMMTTSTFNTLLAPLPSSSKPSSLPMPPSSSLSARRFATRHESPAPDLALARAPAPPRALSLPLLRMDEFIFHRIKTFFSQSKQGKWSEFLLCLHMVESGLITRFELITLGQDWFPTAPQLWEEFDRFLAAKGFTDDAQEDAWFSVPMTDVDFDGTAEGEQELHFGGRNVSYHFLPKDYPPVSSANASPLLNSQLIAVPNHLNPNYTPVAVTTTASATMVSLVRNACEEKLFKCEDDQYEMSLLVDCNQSTIQLLELAMEEGEVSFPRLTVLHIKAIARVYGEDATLMLESLKKNPKAAIPVIVSRLKQKDLEWKLETTRQEDLVWREVLRENLEKSQDYQNGCFKQADKKLPKQFLGELRDAQYELELEFNHQLVHRFALQLVGYLPDDQLPALSNGLNHAVLVEWIASRVIPGFSACKSLTDGVELGQTVLTRFGVGIVMAITADGEQVSIKLAVSERMVTTRLSELAQPPPPPAANLEEEGTMRMLVSSDGLLFIRFYHVLCDRLMRLEELCVARGDLSMQDFVQDACKTFVDGTLSSAQFDEQCAALFGNKSYFCSTLDKLVGQICKLAQGLINEDKAMKMVEISKRFQPSSIASCIEFRRSTLEALQFPRNCACVAVLVTRKQPHCLVLESSAQLPGTFDENKLVMEFFEPAQVDFAPPSPSGRGGWRREATTYTLSVFSSRWYSADEDGFKTSKQNQLILKTLKSAAAAAGGAEQEEWWWDACLLPSSPIPDSLMLRNGASNGTGGGDSGRGSEEEEEVVPTRKRRKTAEDTLI